MKDSVHTLSWHCTAEAILVQVAMTMRPVSIENFARTIRLLLITIALQTVLGGLLLSGAALSFASIICSRTICSITICILERSATIA